MYRYFSRRKIVVVMNDEVPNSLLTQFVVTSFMDRALLYVLKFEFFRQLRFPEFFSNRFCKQDALVYKINEYIHLRDQLGHFRICLVLLANLPSLQKASLRCWHSTNFSGMSEYSKLKITVKLSRIPRCSHSLRVWVASSVLFFSDPTNNYKVCYSSGNSIWTLFGSPWFFHPFHASCSLLHFSKNFFRYAGSHSIGYNIEIC